MRAWQSLLLLMSLLLPAGCADSSSHGFLFGIAMEGSPTQEQIKAFAQETGLTPRAVVIFYAWPEDRQNFTSPTPAIQEIAQAGAIPVITWEPFYFPQGSTEPRGIAAEDILGGQWDPYIDRFLQEVAATQTEVWMRFAHEMNTDHYHWGFINREDFGPNAPFLYRRLFRYVVDRSRKLGLENLRWVFCPNAESVPSPDKGARWNVAARYYPGDEWVDILGMDGYNWGTTVQEATWQSRWQSFEEIFDPLHRELRGLAPDKPLWVFETASATEGGSKKEWLAQAAATARAWRLDGIVWFDVDKETNWRLLEGITKEDLAPLKPTP